MSTTVREVTRAFHLWRSYAENELGEEPEHFASAQAWLASFLEALEADLSDEQTAVVTALESLKATTLRAEKENHGSSLGE